MRELSIIKNPRKFAAAGSTFLLQLNFGGWEIQKTETLPCAKTKGFE